MLTYDIIIKHLMPIINSFSLQPTIVMKSEEFPFFNNLFDESFYRYGVEQKNSFINSIKFCLNTNINIETNNISDLVKELDINIIIFDFKNNKIKVEHKNDFVNPWKPTILLANYNDNYVDYWEPIVCKDTKIFSFSSPKAHILKNKIYNEINNVNDNFQEIIDIEGFNNSEISNDSDISENDDNKETFITKDINNLSMAKLNKMKKDELVDLCKKLNKTITKKNFTKKDLIDLINL